VALVEGRRTVCTLSHERQNAHGESILPLIEQALAEAGWTQSSLDRIAVGLGPGSFTGLRVGISLAQGISEGLEVPLIGVGSLEAMARAAPLEHRGLRCPVLDARREEMFVALYAPDGMELEAPQLVTSVADLRRFTTDASSEVLFLGSAPRLLESIPGVFRSFETDLPHARWVALTAEQAPASAHARPIYIRDAVAVVPHLPPNPLHARGNDP
jgi:tRNA threonylcarbamoyladenosine biosynthesis protein TsaB